MRPQTEMLHNKTFSVQLKPDGTYTRVARVILPESAVPTPQSVQQVAPSFNNGAPTQSPGTTTAPQQVPTGAPPSWPGQK